MEDQFSVNFEKKQDFTTATAQSTRLGRAPTTIATALEHHKKKPRKDPIPEIQKAVISKSNYYGQKYEIPDEPFTLPQDEITHSLFVGSTGTGKGVELGGRVLQSILEKRGIGVIDPKNDAYLVQIILEALAKAGRPASDLKMVYFPNKWGYKAITERDTYLEISNKLISLFGFTPSDNSGVDHYRGLGRTLLRKLMKMFFVEFSLGVSIKKDFLDIQKHIIFLKQDLENRGLYEKELGRTKPNCDLMEKYSKRFYSPEVLEKLYFADSDISTLDTLAIKFQEISEGVNFENDVDIADALYNGKILYFRCDMNDIASLQWVKFLIVDLIQNAKKKKANMDVYCDEISFYAEKTLAGALATVRSMGLQFSLFLQALSQLNDEIRDDIIENCNFKMFYKSSNETTLKYLELVGGVEAITTISSKDGSQNFSQEFEPFLNVTKMRAFPRTAVAVVVAEFLPFPQIIQTNFVAVEKEFDWSYYQNYGFEKIDITKIEADKNISDDRSARKSKLDRYRVYLKESKSLLENSDLMGITLGYEEL
ncbi:MAG: TraM recognition domain-containing protein [Desulfuromonadaceae bacterium]|nr:TraM recognition domain-containing protein [Desulfuromonadaceae bacterium]